jgi:ABC-type antimicrobial peptide transport system permease subunit
VFVAIRARGDERALIPGVRAALTAVDPSLPPYNIRTFDEVRAWYVAERRFAMIVMLLFAALAATLSAIGLYGVVSYLTQLRTREIGIRIALGATTRALLVDTMRTGVANAAAGVIGGAVVAAALSRLFISRVPGIQPLDMSALIAIGAAMLVVATATVWVPARRAARVDAIEALRTDG